MARRLPLLVILLLTGYSTTAIAGKRLHVLFIGNSYTYVNNMPAIAADIAASGGDTLTWDMVAPGGETLYGHMTSAATLNKIQQGHWDYVVLQEQSQAPALPDYQLPNVYMPARRLDSIINVYNPCGETMFYMTWGRKNGDATMFQVYGASAPWYSSYHGMDSALRARYRIMADSNRAVLSPVGAVWRVIRQAYPSINLYDADESHPSPAGSYAAACTFYSALFRKNPLTATYNYVLSVGDAANIRTAVKQVVFDSMAYWHLGQYRTEAAFSHSVAATTVTFINSSVNAGSYSWHFGDGQAATTLNAVHTYTGAGTYPVRLIATSSTTGCKDTVYSRVLLGATGVGHAGESTAPFSIAPNPCNGVFSISLQGERARVAVYNAFGQLVHSKEGSDIMSVDLRDQPRGWFFVRVAHSGGLWDTKLLVQ